MVELINVLLRGLSTGKCNKQGGTQTEAAVYKMEDLARSFPPNSSMRNFAGRKHLGQLAPWPREQQKQKQQQLSLNPLSPCEWWRPPGGIRSPEGAALHLCVLGVAAHVVDGLGQLGPDRTWAPPPPSNPLNLVQAWTRSQQHQQHYLRTVLLVEASLPQLAEGGQQCRKDLCCRNSTLLVEVVVPPLVFPSLA